MFGMQSQKSVDTNKQKVHDILTRGISEVIDKDSLYKKLISGKRLRIKLGIDPTSPHPIKRVNVHSLLKKRFRKTQKHILNKREKFLTCDVLKNTLIRNGY